MFGLTGQPTRKGRLLRTGVAAAAAAATAVALVGPVLPAHASSGTTTARLFGSDRYGTAGNTAAAKFPSGVATVALASGLNFPDALAGAFWAGQGPDGILLTDPQSVPSNLTNALTSLKVKNITILGGTNAVSQSVQNQLASTASSSSAGGNLVVTRISGATRYDTMQLVDTQPSESIGTYLGKKTAIIASGANFPDALSGSGMSYKLHFPVVLTDPNTLSPQASNVLQSLGIQQVVIMGGTAAVSAGVESSINGMGISTLKRFAGADRTDTAQQAATYEVANFGFSNQEVVLARGDDFADALSGAQYSGDPKPTLLASNPTTLGTPTTQYLQANASGIQKITALGGTAAIADSTLQAAQSAAGGNPSNTGQGTGGVTGGQVPGSHPSTAGPDLTTVALLGSNNFGTSASSVVEFTFDKPINASTAAAAVTHFRLIGPTSANTSPAPTSCTASSSGSAVDCSFAPTVNVGNFTIGVVDGNALTGGSGGTTGNPLGSQPFGGFSGTSNGGLPNPTLSSASVSGTGSSVTYTFSTNVTVGAIGSFGFIDSSGNETNGTTAAGAPTTSGMSVTVTWPAGITPSTATQFFAKGADPGVNAAPAVTATTGGFNNLEGHTGGTINTRPTLTGVSHSATGPSFFDFTFDKSVSFSPPDVAAAFEVYLTNSATPGAPCVGAGTPTAISLNTLEVSMTAVTAGCPAGTINQSSTNLVAAGAVDEAIATATNGSGPGHGAAAADSTVSGSNFANTVASVSVGGTQVSTGTFNGPVLLSAVGHLASNSVTYTFSVPVTAPAVGGFFVVGPGGGGTFPAAGSTSVSGNTVSVIFGTNSTAGMVGAGVVSPQGTEPAGGGAAIAVPPGQPAAVTDVQGNANAPGDVSASTS